MDSKERRLSRIGFAAIANTSSVLVGPNPRRLALMISAPVTARITIGRGDSVALDQGINIPPNVSPVWLDYSDIGHSLTESISAIAANAGGETIGFLEVFE